MSNNNGRLSRGNSSGEPLETGASDSDTIDDILACELMIPRTNM